MPEEHTFTAAATIGKRSFRGSLLAMSRQMQSTCAPPGSHQPRGLPHHHQRAMWHSPNRALCCEPCGDLLAQGEATGAGVHHKREEAGERHGSKPGEQLQHRLGARVRT